MNRYPESWPSAPLGEICTKVTDGTHHSPTNEREGDFKYVTAKNIRPWGLDLSDITYVTGQVHGEIFSRCRPEFEDVLYIKDGVTTGLAAVNTLREPFSMLSSVALLKPRRRLVDPYFLKHWLNSPDTFRDITGRMTGTAIRRVVLRQLRAVEAPVPPLNEQKRIVAKIEALQKRSDAAKEALDAIPPLLEKFRQSVLAAAFRGDLTKKWREQNPNVEPASQLLERIRAEGRKKWIEDAAEKSRAKAEAKAKKAGKKWSKADGAAALEKERAKAEKKYKEPPPIDADGLPELPEGWCWTSVGAIAEVQLGQRRAPEFTHEVPHPYIRSANITWPRQQNLWGSSGSGRWPSWW